MQCTMCGREIANPEANYCDYCGTAVRNAEYREVQPVQPASVANVEKKDRVSTWLFLGIMCLPFIPFVGTLAYLGFLFYWGFAPSIEDSRKSFARATLIYTAIMLVLVMIFVGVFAVAVANNMAGYL